MTWTMPDLNLAGRAIGGGREGQGQGWVSWAVSVWEEGASKTPAVIAARNRMRRMQDASELGLM